MRSTVRPGSAPAWSTNSVSKSLRAGWPSPMLRASKLCQSVSTSGPSAIWKPSPTNTSSSRSHAWVTRWAWPRRGLAGELGEVEPLGLDPARPARPPPSSSRRAASAAAAAAVASLSAWPAALRSSTVASEPSRVFSWARSPRLPSSWASSAATSSSVVAAAIRSSAASRAARMSSINGSPFDVSLRERPRVDSGSGAVDGSSSPSPGSPGAPKSAPRQSVHGRHDTRLDRRRHNGILSAGPGPPRSTAPSSPSPR